MKKMLIACLLVCTTFISTFSSIMTVNASSTVSNDVTSISTPSDYINWLKDKSITDPNALNIIKQFGNLSVFEQQKFVNYLNDESLIPQIINALSTTPPGKTISLKNGDIKITSGKTTSKENISTDNINPMASTSYRVTEYATSTLLTIDVIKTIHEMTYTVVNGKAGAVTYGNHDVIRNWYPPVSLSWGNIWNRTYGSQAASSRDLKYSFLLQGVLTIGTNRFTIWGTSTGGSWLDVEHL